jgi:hypothetical protein
MDIDVAGRIRNVQLPASKPLLPLFEAVINSIQSIEDASESNGKIDIQILRDESSLFSHSDQQLADVKGFIITDNGIGFDEENFKAFTTSDTTFKASRGGRGIGRFMWLAAFDSVEISSVFISGPQVRRRRFEFCSSGTGIKNHSLTDEDDKVVRQTTIHLVGFKDRFSHQCPKRSDTIASYIVEEFLDYFLGSNCPVITLREQEAAEVVSLDAVYDRMVQIQSSQRRIMIKEKEFDLSHVRLYSSHIGEHRIYFCAHGRAVVRERLGGIPNLAKRFVDDNGNEFVYAVYVNSTVLNDAVNADRTGFTISEEGADLLPPEITFTEIRETIREKCKEFLSPYTAPIAAKKRERIQRFVQDEGVMYRPIMKHIEPMIEMIDPEASDGEIDRQLYGAYQRLQVEIREEGRKLLESTALEDNEFEEFRERFDEYFEKISEVNRADLARYVCHRKAIIEFLQKQLGQQDDGKYRYEDRIHSIVFPRGKTSDDVLFEDHNLWLVDERLAFHVCLSSDKPISRAEVLESKSRNKPDILVFDKAVAFSETTEMPFSSITIVEFKKPARTEYDEKENPFTQVYRYIEDIKAGKARLIDGRPLPIQQNLPFYCYVICDLTPKLREWASFADLRLTPDGLGFFGYNGNYGAYVEVISYGKIVTDARKRNQAFFSKLGLPDRIS